MRARLAVLAVAGLIAVLGVTAITASGTGHETEVRITAALAADGRIEFALQQREADEGWSERLLPRARFFPATVAAGRWLVSTPLTVRAPGDGDDAAGTEVRIVAQRLADGRTEFALQQREADDEWGERLLPRARFFPATVTVGRWLVSTPLTVSLPELLLGTAADGGSVASDRAALVALYNATEGASWSTRTNWLSGRPLDEWHGVTTNSNGRVTELDLSSNDLHGALPAALGDLTNLESLRLSDNALTGQIPAALGDLTNLRALNLGSEGRGKLTGPIPAALGNLTNLESLDLSSNELTGSIPAWLGDLSNLRALNLSSNPLTGRIPAALGNLTNLESLWLGWNELTGPVPAWAGRPLQPGRAGPLGQRVDGADPGRAGRPLQPGRAGPLVQPVDGADPGLAGRPHQPEIPGPRDQPVGRADPGRAGRPLQPGRAVAVGKPVDGVRAGRLTRCSRRQ